MKERIPKFLNNRDKDTKNLCFVNTTLKMIFKDDGMKHYFKNINIHEQNTQKMTVCVEIARLFQNVGE